MHNQPEGIRLVHEPVALNPAFPITQAGGTHSPDARVTALHYHDSMEIGYCYEGSGVFLIDDQILPFRAGCASVIGKHQLHIARSSAEQGSKWKFINLDGLALAGRAFPEALTRLERSYAGGIFFPDDPAAVAPLVRELIEESGRADTAAGAAIRGLALAFLARLSRAEATHPAGPLARSVSAALDYIVQNYSRPIYIAELAQACGMSMTAFRRAFSAAMGMAPNDYIHRLRVQLAAMQLLYSPLPVVEVALMAGYESLSGFNRHFKQIMGVSPREWRRAGEISK